MLLHESNGYFACVCTASARTLVGLGRGGAGLGLRPGGCGTGGDTGVGVRGRNSGGEAERERGEGASQVTDGTCAREGVLFTRTSDGRCTNMPGGRVEACGVRTGCRPSVRASFGSALLRAVRRSLLLC